MEKNPHYLVYFDKSNTSQVDITLVSYDKSKTIYTDGKHILHTHQYNATQLIDGTLTLGKAVTDAGGKVFWETDAGIQEWVSG